MKYFASFLVLFLIFVENVFGQSTQYQTLQQYYKAAKHDSIRCKILNEMLDYEKEESSDVSAKLLFNITSEHLKTESKVEIIRLYSIYQINAACQLSYFASLSGDTLNATKYGKLALATSEKNKYELGIANAYKMLGYCFQSQSNYTISQDYNLKSLELYKKINYKSGISEVSSNLGMDYENLGDAKSAYNYYNNSLKIAEQQNDYEGISIGFMNLATITWNAGDTLNAEKYALKSLEAARKTQNQMLISNSMSNIATLQLDRGDFESARKLYSECLPILKKINYLVGEGQILNNIGGIFFQLNNNDSALYYFEKALIVLESSNYKEGIANTNKNIAKIYLRKHDIKKAYEYGSKALEIAKMSGAVFSIRGCANVLQKILREKGDYKAALEMNDYYIMMKDSISNIDNKKMSFRNQVNYEYEKKVATDLVKQDEERKLNEERLKGEKTKFWYLFGGLCFTLISLIFAINRFRHSQKQKKIIFSQKQLVDEKQKEILDSITYAKRLQDAILPEEDEIKNCLPDSFVLYEPKAIVAGDFYWLEKFEEKILIAAADSTGHGVPGAMVSVICSNALNSAVKEFGLRETGKILDKTRQLVLETFSKSKSEVKDGMDISLLSICKKTNQIEWSGANNQLLYISNGELIEIKADKQPIGKSDHSKPFTTHSISFNKGDLFYLITDGFADQFGGAKGKKFMYKQLKETLLAISEKPIDEQNEALNNILKNWMGNAEQVDDITIIGIKI